MPRPAAFLDFPEDLWSGYGPERGYMAVFDRAHDGDTYVMVCDVGLDTHPAVWIRLQDVDCPELYEPGGPEATEFVRSLFAESPHCLIRVSTRPVSRRQVRSFIRFVATVELSEGRDLGEIIVANGHGAWV